MTASLTTRVGQKPLDPLIAAGQPLGRPRQARRHVHQVGAAHLKHRRHQQRQLAPLRLTLARQALLHVRRDGLGQLLDPTHSRRSAHPGALNHTPSLLATKLTHDKQTELLGFDDDGTRVLARLRGPDGTEQVCEAEYLAGCDGARSTVRDVLGTGFPGGTYAHLFYVADAEVRGPVVNESMQNRGVITPPTMVQTAVVL